MIQSAASIRQLKSCAKVFLNSRRHSSGLRQLFDSTNHQSLDVISNPVSGLFGYSILSSASGFKHAAQQTIVDCDKIIHLVCSAHLINDVLMTVKRLDHLSDILCSVVDAAQLIKTVHPDENYAKQADEAFNMLSNYMNHLNTHSGLYNALKRVVEDPNIKCHVSLQEIRVAQLLIDDFEKSGIHMKPIQKKKFISLHEKIRHLGSEFVQNAHPSVSQLTISNPQENLDGLSSPLIQSVIKKGGTSATIKIGSAISHLISRIARKESIRKSFFKALNSSNKLQIETLEEMLQARSELAKLLGFSSYSHLYLQKLMIASPENASAFIKSLADFHKPIAQNDIEILSKIKKIYTKDSNAVLEPWDPSYCAQFVPTTQVGDANSLSSYFSVGRCFEGLSFIFNSLFEVTLEPATFGLGETWHPDVRKLNVIHKRDGKIGTIYCDLYKRSQGEPLKFEQAAHYTIRCSRTTLQDSEFSLNNSIMKNISGEKALKDHTTGKTRIYQLPIIVLVTDFIRPTDTKPSLLQVSEMETLFHEMGHAIHSMLGRTEFQHVSGTRVPIDFVEVPSIFMEKFVMIPGVVSKFASHYKTNQKLDGNEYSKAVAKSNVLESIEIQNQLFMATLDQLYHSELANDYKFDSTKMLKYAQNQTHVLSYVENTAWQIQFSHLFGYGASYYSYFWSRRWASRLHSKLIEGKRPEEWSQVGELLNSELLGLGGSRDPWIGLEKLGIVRDGEREGVYRNASRNDLY